MAATELKHDVKRLQTANNQPDASRTYSTISRPRLSSSLDSLCHTLTQVPVEVTMKRVCAVTCILL